MVKTRYCAIGESWGHLRLEGVAILYLEEGILDLNPQEVLDNFDSVVEFRLFSQRKHLTLTLPEQIAAQLGDKIIAGEMRDGAHIPEQELAEHYQVSRGPIRDALRILEKEGLVVLNPRKGATVSELNTEELAEIFEVRASLLSLAARKNALRRDPGYLKTLRYAIKKLSRYLEPSDDESKYAETAYRMSLLSARYAGNRLLADIVTSLSLQTLRYSKLGSRSIERRRHSYELWQQALEAIEAGDADRAAALSWQRVQDSWHATLRALEENEPRPRR